MCLVELELIACPTLAKLVIVLVLRLVLDPLRRWNSSLCMCLTISYLKTWHSHLPYHFHTWTDNTVAQVCIQPLPHSVALRRAPAALWKSQLEEAAARVEADLVRAAPRVDRGAGGARTGVWQWESSPVSWAPPEMAAASAQ